jgi:hypothetical protein
MTSAALLASGLGSLRRLGLLLVAAGIALVLLAANPGSSGGHRLDGGSALRLATTTTVPADTAP